MIIILLGFITPLWIIDKDRYCKECILPYKKYIVKKIQNIPEVSVLPWRILKSFINKIKQKKKC